MSSSSSLLVANQLYRLAVEDRDRGGANWRAKMLKAKELIAEAEKGTGGGGGVAPESVPSTGGGSGAGGGSGGGGAYSIPQPLKVELVDKKKKEEPDTLPATQNGTDNVDLVPYNRACPTTKCDYDTTVTFANSIGGQEQAVALLESSLVTPFNPVFANVLSKVIVEGIMLYGVPGTGKTTLATAAVNSASMDNGRIVYRSKADVDAMTSNPRIKGWTERHFSVKISDDAPPVLKVPRVIFFVVRPSDIESKYIGEAQRKLSRFFEMGKAVAPAVLFLDEAETYFNDKVEYNAPTITGFKQLFGGIGDRGRVFVIIATNYPNRIEAAIRDRMARGSIEITLPNYEARKKIVELEIKNAMAGNVLRAGKTNSHALWVLNPVQVVTAITEATAQAQTLEEFRSGKRQLWSARTISGTIKDAISRVIVGGISGRVVSCASAAGGENVKRICDTVDPGSGKQGYVPDDSGTMLATELPREGATLLPRIMTAEDFLVAIREASPSVAPDALLAQLEFNVELNVPKPMNLLDASKLPDNTRELAIVRSLTIGVALRQQLVDSIVGGIAVDAADYWTKGFASRGVNTTIVAEK